jgi:hypothetical protein
VGWPVEFVDEAVCLLDENSWNDCVMFPYPYKLFGAAVVRQNNRCVTGVENSNIDSVVTEMVD